MAREIAAADARDDLAATIMSRQNEKFAAFEAFSDRLFPVDTFASARRPGGGASRRCGDGSAYIIVT